MPAFAAGETPALKLHGTARRTDSGSLHLPDGAPWGWVQAGDGALDDLRGLRSFTILGWLKPESLQVGSGGNRIVFCLNKDHSGIDLVCHADGRLRLAVNQWPDSDSERQFARQTAGRQMDLLRRDLRRDADRRTT